MTDREKAKASLVRSLADILGGQQPIFTSETSGERQPSLADSFWGQPLAPPPPPIIQQRWFKDQTIHIDGYIFERCRFDRCSLVTELATFSFRECFISPDCRIYFKGPALKVARLLMHVLRLQQRMQFRSDEAGIYATIHGDGTFSLE